MLQQTPLCTSLHHKSYPTSSIMHCICLYPPSMRVIQGNISVNLLLQCSPGLNNEFCCRTNSPKRKFASTAATTSIFCVLPIKAIQRFCLPFIFATFMNLLYLWCEYQILEASWSMRHEITKMISGHIMLLIDIKIWCISSNSRFTQANSNNFSKTERVQ